MAVFVLVLLVPFAYLLSVGALEWGPVHGRRRPRSPGPLLRTEQRGARPGLAAASADEEEAA